MQDFWPTVFFWAAWVVISSLILKNFYYAAKKELAHWLRLFNLMLDLLVLALFFLPWLPQAMGGDSGFKILLRGKFEVAAYAIPLILAIVFFFFQRPVFSKIAAVCHVAASISIFIVMVKLLPGTTNLVIRDTAPIFSALLLLAGDVVALLLWNQLQKLSFAKASSYAKATEDKSDGKQKQIKL